ncbi:MAG: Rrf2 family transcriptional regulator [Alphaproteobacteria bacterium]|nr:Rrf2 family transcriptional regulator [Alphaproteobacteria bacterium]
MLSQKARYALRAMLHLAGHSTTESVQIADIAEGANVPRKFLEQILVELKRRGLVHSVRGRHGGYLLGREPKAISFAEIIRIIDGPLALSPCASRTAYRRCEDCVDETTCAIRKSLVDVRNSTARILEQHSLADALADRRKIKPGA